jgi:hypothetical protein
MLANAMINTFLDNCPSLDEIGVNSWKLVTKRVGFAVTKNPSTVVMKLRTLLKLTFDGENSTLKEFQC